MSQELDYVAPADALYTAEQAARYLTVSRWAIERWVKLGRLHKVKVGKLVRFRGTELERFINQSSVPKPARSTPKTTTKRKQKPRQRGRVQ